MSTSAQPTPPFQPKRSSAPPAVSRAAQRARGAPDTRAAAAQLLRGVHVLAELEPAVIDRLAERCETLELDEGQTLFRAGEECVGVYVVAEGLVRLTRPGRETTGEARHAAAPGHALNGLPLARGERHTVSAVTAEPSRVLFLSRHVVEGLYREDPEVAHAIIQSLASRLQDVALRAHALTFRDVAPRLALLLASYAERWGTPARGGGVDLDLGRTQEEIAQEIGAARESVSRAWGQLRDQGLIHPRRGHRVYVPDVQALRDLAQP